MLFHLKISIFFILVCTSCTKEHKTEFKTAVFGGGCFWTLDYYFDKLEGVSQSRCIYTNHKSEAVLLTYDPAKVSFEELCMIFFDLHDASTDYKPSYRSLIQVNEVENIALAQKIIYKIKAEKSIKTVVETVKEYSFPEEFYEDWHLNKNSIPKCSIPDSTKELFKE